MRALKCLTRLWRALNERRIVKEEDRKTTRKSGHGPIDRVQRQRWRADRSNLGLHFCTYLDYSENCFMVVQKLVCDAI